MYFINTIVAVLGLAASTFAAPTEPLVPRQGYISTCNKTYTVVSGDTCLVIINKQGNTFTLDQFYSWNPQVSSSCSNLYPGEAVCVGVSTTPPPPTGCAAPTQPGTAANCRTCYTVAPGDTCLSITQPRGVSLTDFYAWNPSVNAGCTNLQPGYNYCVGV
ncbi:carbohydrate-binding module family 50 protein [Hypoxylon sp. NC0597]|nr:carbohydrate-binding module family 50 protein [Hypoxylon sp. NC0597]